MGQSDTYRVPANPSKAGRLLYQMNAGAIEMIMGVPWNDIRHPYIVVFEAMNAAGNHYHHRKRELICVARGTVRVTLAYPDTHERWSVLLSDNPMLAAALGVAVPLGIAHVVEPLTQDAALLVFATAPAREPDDDLPYDVLAPR